MLCQTQATVFGTPPKKRQKGEVLGRVFELHCLNEDRKTGLKSKTWGKQDSLRILGPQKWRHFEDPKRRHTGSNPSIGGSLGILRVNL